MELKTKPEDIFVWWDWGGVLGHFDADVFSESLAAAFGVDVLELSHFVRSETTPSVWLDLDTGMPEDEIRKKFCARFNVQLSPEEFRDAFNKGITVNAFDARLLPIMQEFHAYGFRQGMISNMNPLHGEFIKAHNPKAFQYIRPELRFFSYEIGFRKGHGHELFQHIRNASGALPMNSFLIDDRLDNVQWFNDVGGKGVFLTSGGYQQVRYEVLYELSKRGVIASWDSLFRKSL